MKLKDRRQNDKSNAPSGPSSKSGNNHDLSLQMKLKDWSQNSKSKAPSSTSRNTYDLLSIMKLGPRK